MLVAHDPSEAPLDGVEGHRRPAQRHRAALPVPHPPHPVTQRRVTVVDQVRRPQAAAQLAGQAQAVDREHLAQPFTQRARRARPIAFQPPRVLFKLRHALLRVQLERRLGGSLKTPVPRQGNS